MICKFQNLDINIMLYSLPDLKCYIFKVAERCVLIKKNEHKYGEGTIIKGYKIVGEAIKITDHITIAKTSRNKAQRIFLKDNAICRIAKKYRFIK